MEEGAHGEVLSIAFAGKGQIQDAGGKIVPCRSPIPAPLSPANQSAKGVAAPPIVASSRVAPNASNSKSNVFMRRADFGMTSLHRIPSPYIEIENQDVTIGPRSQRFESI